MEQFLEQFLGTKDTLGFGVSYLIAVIGALIMLRFEASKRDKASKNTPYAFNPWFLLRDNLIRIFTSLLLIYVGIRFSDLIFGSEITFYTALVIGASLDKISQWLKNISARK